MADEFKRLIEYQRKLDEVEYQIIILTNQKDQIIESMAEIIDLYGGSIDQKHKLAHHLYWNEGFSEKLLARLLDCKPQQVIYRLPNLEPKPCSQCGESYPTKVYMNGNWYDFLCDNCKRANRSERKSKPSELYPDVPKPLDFFDEEAQRQELATMPYSEYLQTEHWKTLRKAMFKRAGFRCQLCNAQGELHVHHKTYERRGAELYSDLIVLCKNCHAKHHDKD